MGKLKELALFIVVTTVIAVFLYYSTLTGFSYGGWDKWILIVINSVFLALFILFIPLKKKMTRLPSSVYVAFVVALYAEMYGFPLNMYVFAGTLGYDKIFSMEFLLITFGLNVQWLTIFTLILWPLLAILY